VTSRQATALNFLARVTADRAIGGLESLELGISDRPDALKVDTPLDEREIELVDRTVNKIADRRPLDPAELFALEAIIIPDKRPVLDVLAGNIFSTDHPLWQDLTTGDPLSNLQHALPAVGRVELIGHPSLTYGGTGFVVGTGLLMTNRHVAEIFANGLGSSGLLFKPGQGAIVNTERRVDGGSLPLSVSTVRMIHPYWDMALLAVEGLPDSVVPLKLAVDVPIGQPRIAAIGYPAFDPRNDAEVQARVFRNVYDVKRIMPGLLTGWVDVPSFGKTVHVRSHDSSTLGGASGSAVVDLATGAVLALHFGGNYLDTNYGVPASALASDGRVIDAGVNYAGKAERVRGPWDDYWDQVGVNGAAPTPMAIRAAPPARSETRSAPRSITIPLRITVEIGNPAPAPVATVSPSIGDQASEAPRETYLDRAGYQSAFLGADIPLPTISRAADDILTYDRDGVSDHVLRYQHFSVVMSRSRRLCFFSAGNIDGATSRKSTRTGWRLDPRIPASQQILNECYGSPPKFSRGHMTRREDPVWGSPEDAALGNSDSMHVTNTVPQMQAFNSPIWLGLEDYALQHARSDAMRLSVFTGPYFSDDDPAIDGVRIPLCFWKVIAFLHDESGQLSATGYEMDQSGALPPSGAEFVFGDYVSPQTGVSAQVALRTVERRAGLLFGELTGRDPFGGASEAAFAPPRLERSTSSVFPKCRRGGGDSAGRDDQRRSGNGRDSDPACRPARRTAVRAGGRGRRIWLV
jgi:endonuclease G